MLTVHHLGISHSDRIVWLCKELQIPYELVHYDRDPKSGMAPAEYRAPHPFGTAPVISDGDLILGNPQQSSAISSRNMATDACSGASMIGALPTICSDLTLPTDR